MSHGNANEHKRGGYSDAELGFDDEDDDAAAAVDDIVKAFDANHGKVDVPAPTTATNDNATVAAATAGHSHEDWDQFCGQGLELCSGGNCSTCQTECSPQEGRCACCKT